jgi:hypothetical protein
MVLLSFVILIIAVVGGVAGSLLPRRSTSLSWGTVSFGAERLGVLFVKENGEGPGIRKSRPSQSSGSVEI